MRVRGTNTSFAPWAVIFAGSFVLLLGWQIVGWVGGNPFDRCTGFQADPGKWTVDAWNSMRLCADQNVKFRSGADLAMSVTPFEGMKPALHHASCNRSPKTLLKQHDVVLCRWDGRDHYSLLVVDNPRTQALKTGVEIDLFVTSVRR